MRSKADTPTPGLSEIGRILARDAETITATWLVKDRRALSSASGAHREELRNMIPEYLKALGAELSSAAAAQSGRNRSARIHGIHRWQSGWALNEVVADYQLLQITILDHLTECLQRPLAMEEMKTLGACIDDAIREAVTSFADHSQEELRAINATLEERIRERSRLAEDRAQRLKRAARDLIRAKQQERQKIARILHDDLQQLIAAGRLRCEGLHPDMPRELHAAEQKVVVEMLERAMTISKRLAVELRPPVDAGNLAGMLDWIKESMIADYDLHIAVAADPAGITVEEEIGLLIYQSLRELLFNIVKHGDCDRASLEAAAVDRDWIVLTVSDNGSGFDASRLETKKNRGFGLNYIRERLEMIDGKMEVWSEVGTGTRIQMRVPKRLE